jgi:hypothetical protein
MELQDVHDVSQKKDINFLEQFAAFQVLIPSLIRMVDALRQKLFAQLDAEHVKRMEKIV